MDIKTLEYLKNNVTETLRSRDDETRDQSPPNNLETGEETEHNGFTGAACPMVTHSMVNADAGHVSAPVGASHSWR